MITIRNRLRANQINSHKIKVQATLLLQKLGYKGFDLGIWLTTNKTIRMYNQKYRSKNTATDILSFPSHPHIKAGERIIPASFDEKSLGDLIISIPYVIKHAPKWNQTFDERMKVLLVHGICHLLGYDHEFDADYEIMKKEEERLLEFLS